MVLQHGHSMMSWLNDMTKKIKQLEQQIAALTTQLNEEKRKQFIVCGGCSKRIKLKDLKVLEVYHYVSPYSCSGGDYWKFSEEYISECPHCGSEGRAYPWRYSGEMPEEYHQRDALYKFLRENLQFIKEVKRFYRE